ncbi:MAG: hypothetical protein H7X99_04680, partial [Saprospiraceae bacterium]|nr:hypothetical protein [Saprospiraceae bacterium]
MSRSFLIVALLCTALVFYPVKKGFTYVPADNDEPIELKEAYETLLFHKLQSVQNLIDFVDRTYKGNKNSIEFVNYIGKVISRRFHHGYSHYSSDDNWIASMAGNIFWKNLSAIVIPDDIMKHPVAACSQQCIIMMACATHFGFDVRKVTFDHHFTTEVKVRNKWHYLDPNLEVIPLNSSLQELLDSNTFLKLYENKLGVAGAKYVLAHPKFGATNEQVARKARYFHEIT